MAWMIGPLAKLLDGLPALLAPFLTWVGNFLASFMSLRGVVEARTSSPDCYPKSTFPLGISHKSPTPPREGSLIPLGALNQVWALTLLSSPEAQMPPASQRLY